MPGTPSRSGPHTTVNASYGVTEKHVILTSHNPAYEVVVRSVYIYYTWCQLGVNEAITL